eukprot:137582_1
MARLHIGFQTVIAVFIGVILLILLIIITVKSFSYLLCNTAESKKTYVNTLRHDNKQKIQKRKVNISYEPIIRYGTLSSLTLYLTANICSLSHMFVLLSTFDVAASPGPLLFDISVFSWTLARICMRFVFVARLKYSFEYTQWEYDRKVFIVLYFLLCIFPLIMFYFLLQKFVGGHDIWRSQLHTKINTIILSVLMALDVLFPSLLIFLFQRKLFQLIQSYLASIEKFQLGRTNPQDEVDLCIDIGGGVKNMETQTHSRVSFTSRSNNRDSTRTVEYERELPTKSSAVDPNDPYGDQGRLPFTKGPKKDRYGKIYVTTKCMFINTITQYTLLICVAAIMSIAHMSYSVVKRNATMNEDEFLCYTFDYQFSSLFMSFINSLCLFLQFPFGLGVYKCLCSNRLCLHRLCVSIYTRCTPMKV